MIRLFFSLLIILLLVSLFGNQAKAQLKPAQSQYLEQVGSFINPGFEQGFKGWTISGCSKSIETEVPYLGKSLKIECLNQGFSVAQETTKLTAFSGMKYKAQCLVNTSVAGISVVTKVDGAIDKSTTTSGAGWELLTFRGDIGSASNELEIVIPLTLGAIHVDDCSMAIDKSIFSKGEDGQFLVKDSNQLEEIAWSDNLQGVLNPVTNMISYSPSILGVGTPSNVSFRWSNVGERVFIDGQFTAGTTTASPITITLPENFTAKTLVNSQQVGIAFRNAGSASVNDFRVLANNGDNTLGLGLVNSSGNSPDVRQNGNNIIASGDNVNFKIELTVNELSSGLDSIVRNSKNTPTRAGELVWSFGLTQETSDLVLADGDCYLKSDYPDYMANVGTLYGECTVTTTNDGFNVPDIENRFIRSSGGSLTTGTKQSDTTAKNGLGGATNTTGNHRHRLSYGENSVQGGSKYGTSGTSASKRYLGDGSAVGSIPWSETTGNHSHSLNITGDAETRPDAIVLTAYVRLKNVDNVIAGVFEQIESVDATLDASTANKVSAQISGTPSLTSQDYNWVSSVSSGGSGLIDITFQNTNYTVNPSCQVTAFYPDQADARTCRMESLSTSGLTARCYNATNGSNLGAAFFVSCSRQGADVNKTVKGVIVGASSLKTECQTKYLSADVTSDTTIGDLGFSNLEIGKKYKLIIFMLADHALASNDNISLTSSQGFACYASSTGFDAMQPTASRICHFTANSTSLTMTSGSIQTGNAIRGDVSNAETNVTLCQLPDNTILNSNKWD